jgi:heme-degrading monooxygenase HmoA
MVITVSRSRLEQDHADEVQTLADRMLALVQATPGFISYKSFRAEDGERCSIIEFESREHLQAWREHPDHRRAQALGREHFYTEYSLYIAEPEREAHFRRDQ